jgi:hypothetical protein
MDWLVREKLVSLLRELRQSWCDEDDGDGGGDGTSHRRRSPAQRFLLANLFDLPPAKSAKRAKRGRQQGEDDCCSLHAATATATAASSLLPGFYCGSDSGSGSDSDGDINGDVSGNEAAAAMEEEDDNKDDVVVMDGAGAVDVEVVIAECVDGVIRVCGREGSSCCVLLQQVWGKHIERIRLALLAKQVC